MFYYIKIIIYLIDIQLINVVPLIDKIYLVNDQTKYKVQQV